LARRYSVAFENVAIVAVQDLFEITPAANKPVRLLALFLSNVGGAADAGDAQEELLRIAIRRVPATITSGSGGSAPTPRLVDPSDAAAGLTAEVNNTTQATSSGTIETLHPDGWNIRVPYSLIFTPEMQHEAINGQLLVVSLLNAPADSVNCSGVLYVEEE
jgi:hypothetical protein